MAARNEPLRLEVYRFACKHPPANVGGMRAGGGRSVETDPVARGGPLESARLGWTLARVGSAVARVAHVPRTCVPAGVCPQRGRPAYSTLCAVLYCMYA